jgi:hypothetical protein
LETYHRKYHNTFPPPCCLKTSHVFIWDIIWYMLLSFSIY